MSDNIAVEYLVDTCHGISSMNILTKKAFWRGVTRVLDLGAVSLAASPLRQRYISAAGRLSSSRSLISCPESVDSRALRSDFAAVGNDLRKAMGPNALHRSFLSNKD
jgi:hypothetical protein